MGRINRIAGQVELTHIFHMKFFLRKQHVFSIWKVTQQIT